MPENNAAVDLNRLAEEGIVAGEGCRHGGGVLFPDAGAALHISKEQGDGAGG